ncbi:MAG: hypothetical protein JW876_09755 [Candidatus Krumholzibacteriota bacterium]|nr:hypothetical protein [Candidatus Krumholzibacteriota bacterium]
MRTRIGLSLVGAAALMLLFVAALRVEPLAARQREQEVLYLPSGRFMEQAALEYRNLAADVLWFRTVQYYGSYRGGENDLALFSRLVEVITDLDPQFVFAYLFGAMIIVEDLGSFDEGIRFLEKGIAANPNNWWLVFENGFLHYVDARDYREAARLFGEAARMPGADELAKRFAAFVAAKAGDREAAIAMWDDLARTSEDPYIRDELARRYLDRLEKEIRRPDGEGEETR